MDDEELMDIPEPEKATDPLRHAKITRTIDNIVFTGYVEDIEVGKNTGDRLYRIRYNDGDLEHYTEEQVRLYRIEDPVIGEVPVSKKPAAAIAEEELENICKEGRAAEESVAVSREAESDTKSKTENIHVFKKPSLGEDHSMDEDGVAEAAEEEEDMEVPVQKEEGEGGEEGEEEVADEEDGEEAMEHLVFKKPSAKDVVPLRKSITKSPAKGKVEAKVEAKSKVKAKAKATVKANAKAALKRPAAK